MANRLTTMSRALATVIISLALNPQPVVGQTTRGSAGAALAGGTIGAVTGASLATVGSILPCTRTYAGPRCVRIAAIAGGSIGLGAGMLLGAYDSEQVEQMAERAAYGFAIGAATGFALKQVILYSTWGDVIAAGAIGAAVATDPEAALIGLAAGTVTGLALWQLMPQTDLSEAAELSLVGMALGAVGSLVYRSIDAAVSGDTPAVMLPVRLSF